MTEYVFHTLEANPCHSLPRQDSWSSPPSRHLSLPHLLLSPPLEQDQQLSPIELQTLRHFQTHLLQLQGCLHARLGLHAFIIQHLAPLLHLRGTAKVKSCTF